MPARSATSSGVGTKGRAPTSRRRSVPKRMAHENVQTYQRLVTQLRKFDAESPIRKYAAERHPDSPFALVSSEGGPNIWRAFRHETPSLRYQNWRYVAAADQLLQELNNVDNQEAFDRLLFSAAESLVADWGATNDDGQPSRMNIGLALKITNLVFKRAAFSDFITNPRVKGWLHVPWDQYTLRPLRALWEQYPPIDPTQGFVDTVDRYLALHELISAITREAGVDRITYEFWAWDARRHD